MANRQTIKIQDESGDKDCFTIAPNYILNHSSAIDQSLYFQLKRLAGEKNGSTCYPSFRYLKERMQVGSIKIKKSFKYLIEHKWINDLGKQQVHTKGGLQWMNVYRINNIWKMNSDYYHNNKKGVSNREHLKKNKVFSENAKVCPENAKVCPVIGAYKEPYIKNYIQREKQATACDLQKLIKLFEPINPSYERLFPNTTQRNALQRLVDKFGYSKVEQLLEALPTIIAKKYAPRITTPITLENKLGDLFIFMKQNKNNKSSITII